MRSIKIKLPNSEICQKYIKIIEESIAMHWRSIYSSYRCIKDFFMYNIYPV